MRLAIGEQVRCSKSDESGSIVEGQTYIITDIINSYIYVGSRPLDGWSPSKFERDKYQTLFPEYYEEVDKE